MSTDETVSVRYMVDDVEKSIAFYTAYLASRSSPVSHRRSPMCGAATSDSCSPVRRAPRADRCPTASRPDPGAGTGSISSSMTSTLR
jgi:hypothetical protein